MDPATRTFDSVSELSRRFDARGLRQSPPSMSLLCLNLNSHLRVFPTLTISHWARWITDRKVERARFIDPDTCPAPDSLLLPLCWIFANSATNAFLCPKPLRLLSEFYAVTLVVMISGTLLPTHYIVAMSNIRSLKQSMPGTSAPLQPLLLNPASGIDEVVNLDAIFLPEVGPASLKPVFAASIACDHPTFSTFPADPIWYIDARAFRYNLPSHPRSLAFGNLRP